MIPKSKEALALIFPNLVDRLFFDRTPPMPFDNSAAAHLLSFGKRMLLDERGERTGFAFAGSMFDSCSSVFKKLEKEFEAKTYILGRIQHSNIVKLLCCISSEDSKLLVYEYMENGSLDRWIHGKANGGSDSDSGWARIGRLDWPKRFQIAIGAAQGLCYMHHSCSPPIVHRDV